ncbi:MAG: hypothetical protein ACI4IR_08220 [Eubacterium sp.]
MNIVIEEFYNMIFKNIKEDEYICLQHLPFNGTMSKPTFIQSLSEFKEYINMHQNENVYYAIATSNGKSRTTKDMVSASAIVLDFDFKDENGNHIEMPNAVEFSKELQKKANIFFNLIINSGHGYQFIIEIERTYDLERWHNITCMLMELYGADSNAVKITQLMRVPYTYNVKDGIENKKRVFPITPIKHLDKKYTLEKLEKILNIAGKSLCSQPTMKPCCKEMAKGVPEGDRNFCLGRIVSELNRLGYSKEKIKAGALKFNSRCKPPQDIKDVDNQINGYLKNPSYTSCFIKDKNDKILRKYCKNMRECPYNPKNRNVSKEIPGAQMVRIPIEAFENNLSGAEIAALMLILLGYYDQLDSKYDKCIKQLFELNLIEAKNSYFKVLYPCGITFQIPNHFLDLFLSKKISKNELKFLTFLCFFLENDHIPTSKQLAIRSGTDHSNLCRIKDSLVNKNLIEVEMIPNGAGYINQIFFKI